MTPRRANKEATTTSKVVDAATNVTTLTMEQPIPGKGFPLFLLFL